MPQRKNPLARSSKRPEFAPVPMLMTAREASAYLGLNLYTLYRRHLSGEIRAVLWGKKKTSLRWLRTDLDAWTATLDTAEGPVRGKKATRREPEPAA